MEIRVIIVDDDKNNAFEIQEAIECYESIFKEFAVRYSILKVFPDIFAFRDAKEFISSSQEGIDIILTDYNLKRGLGTDLFQYIRHDLQIYKVLHSTTDISFVNTRGDLMNRVYDDFCYTKDKEAIHKVLKEYETTVLTYKLFGNKLFGEAYFINEHRLNEKASQVFFNDIRYFDIIYAITEKKSEEKMTFFYRNNDTKEVESKSNVSRPLIDLKNHQLIFRRVHRSLIINMLWVAKIDIINSIVRFITLNNTILELKYNPTELFNNEVFPLLNDLNSVPVFLKA